jgi:hypothetical protein
MIYDGIKFRRNYNMIVMREDKIGDGSYCVFGRIVAPHTEGAVMTNRRWQGDADEFSKRPWIRDGANVWAVEVRLSGYSKTNLARAKKQYFLGYGGDVFTAPVTPTHFGMPYDRRTGEYLTQS